MIRSVIEWSVLMMLVAAGAAWASPTRDAAGDELRYLFSRSAPTQGQLVRASRIFALYQHESPERGRALVADLLRSADTRVRRRTLDLLRDQLKFHREYGAVFREWEAAQTPRTLGELADRILPIRAEIGRVEAGQP